MAYSLTSEMSLFKPAARLLGIAEGGLVEVNHTFLGGVVIRGDLIIDGVAWGKVTIRGMDATRAVIKMVQRLVRDDLNGIMLHGTVIAGYNIIDMTLVHQKTGLPVISVTKEPQTNLKEHLMSSFPTKWEERWEIVSRNGALQPLTLETDSTVFVQAIGCNWKTAQGIIKRLTQFGGIPEPIRVARLLARAFAKHQKGA